MKMANFKCPCCEEVSTSEEWDRRTKEGYGDIYSIESSDKNDCKYICPECGSDCDGESIDLE
jgi:hypothetical protein